jgi:serine/threonine-protein kinase RsbW
VLRDGFGWAVLQTLVDAVDAGPSSQDKVPAGNGTPTPVAVVTMEKYLPGQRPGGAVDGAGQNVSVAQ